MRDLLDSMIRNHCADAVNQKKHSSWNPTFIPIHLTGGIGDVVMSVDALLKLNKLFDIVVYTGHPSVLKYFVGDTLKIIKGMPDFNWHLEICIAARFKKSDNFSGFLCESHKYLYMNQQELFANDHELYCIVNSEEEKLFMLGQYGIDHGIHRSDFAMYCLGLDKPTKVFQPDKILKDKVITIHDGFDTQNRSLVSGRATKQWDWRLWNSLVKNLKIRYADYKIVQLGSPETSRPIDGVDENLIGKTNITEAFDLLNKASAHIDGDSGLVHAATRMQTPCVVFWGPSPALFNGYEQNINIQSDSCRGGCHGLSRSWNDKCVLGYQTPICMDTISPDTVIGKLSNIIGL